VSQVLLNFFESHALQLALSAQSLGILSSCTHRS